jgi:signal transduction histidine kinase
MRSLRGRLGFALGATAVLSVAITSAVSVGLLRRNATDNARRDLVRIARAIAADPAGLGDQQVALRQVRRLLAINGDVAAVVLAGGSSAGTGAAVADAVDLRPLVAGTQISGTVRTAGEDYVYVGVPVELARRQTVRGVLMARPVRLARGLGVPIAIRVLLAGLLAIVIAVVVSAALAQRLVRPMRDVAKAASRIARGDLDQRVPVPSDDELGSLARSFNEMALALSEAQRREREFLTSVSHELRTPITAIHGYAEAIEDGAVHGAAGRAEAVGIIRSEADRLERMVQDVMDLARVGTKEFRLNVREADVGEALNGTVAALQGEADLAGVTLESDVPTKLLLKTDPDRVQQVVSNLVQNALRVTEREGSVRVDARKTDEGVLIEVTDTGPGIARADLAHVFERSYLWQASKGTKPVGTGLGLAIVRELVTALGGRVAVESDVNVGTTFRVWLPYA